MEAIVVAIALAVAGTLAVLAFIAWVRRAAPAFEDVSMSVATGETPEQIIDRVAAALADLTDHTTSRRDKCRLAISRSYGPLRQQPAEGLGSAAADVLEVRATPLDIGTRVDIEGRAEPPVVHRVLTAIAKSRPWMRGQRASG
jgi:hypothetical protein